MRTQTERAGVLHFDQRDEEPSCRPWEKLLASFIDTFYFCLSFFPPPDFSSLFAAFLETCWNKTFPFPYDSSVIWIHPHEAANGILILLCPQWKSSPGNTHCENPLEKRQSTWCLKVDAAAQVQPRDYKGLWWHEDTETFILPSPER